ncbi:MAG: ribosomal protein S18-alanine N-acetyltransferase [Terriglobales bacterium]
MSVILRSATLDNLPAMIAIEQRAPTAAHWTAGQYERLLENGFVWVAEQEGEICGFVCAKVVAGEWEIENVVVAQEFQRRGVADRLMGALIREAQKEAGTKILLEVRESNLPARRLYEKRGFAKVGRRRSYYQHPVEDAVLYELRMK